MATTLLVLAAIISAACGQTKYCCAPDQWESKNTFLQGKVDHGQVFVIQGNESLSVDFTNQMINTDSNISTSTGVTMRLRVLIHFKDKKQYIIQGGGCRASPVTSLPPNCIPDSAVKIDKAYYGTNTTKLDVDIYQFTLGPNTNFANIGPGCIPVMVGTYGSQNNVSAVSEKTYTNFSVGIKDPSVFVIPDICKHSQVRGPITSSTIVCSKHFKKEDFKWTPVNKTLKKVAVSSVFDWSEQKTPRRLISRKVLAESTDETSQSTHEEVEYQAEAIPEPMDLDSQQGELKKKELQHLKPSWSKRDKKAKNYKIS